MTDLEKFIPRKLQEIIEDLRIELYEAIDDNDEEAFYELLEALRFISCVEYEDYITVELVLAAITCKNNDEIFKVLIKYYTPLSVLWESQIWIALIKSGELYKTNLVCRKLNFSFPDKIGIWGFKEYIQDNANEEFQQLFAKH